MLQDQNPLDREQFRQGIVEDVVSQVQAIVGRYALAILGTVVILAAGGASAWSNMNAKVDNLESWRKERDAAILEVKQWRSEKDKQLTAMAKDIEWIRKGMESKGK